MENEHTKDNNAEKRQSGAKSEKRFKASLGPVIIIVIGVLWLLNNLGVLAAGDIWVPAVIIVIGMYLLFKKR